MKFTLINAILGLSASLVSATINLGLLEGNHVAWIDGLDQCADNTVINNANQNPCGIVFSLDNSGFHSGYSLSGCGGPDFILLQNGNFNSECHFEPTNIGCPQGTLQQQWSCF